MDARDQTGQRGIGSILVPTDFSNSSASALDWAVAIARAHRARVRLLHAVGATSQATIPAGLREEITRSLEVIEKVVKRAGVEVSSTVVDLGTPWEVMDREARRDQADLVVIGAGGRHYSRLLGSTADRIIRTASVPVLTVHADDPAPPSTFRTVLVATDFSEEAALATSGVLRLLRAFPGKARLVLLHVCYVPPVAEGVPWGGAPVTLPADVEQTARRSLESLAGPLRSDRLDVHVETRLGWPAMVTEAEARSAGADLVALGTVGRGGLRHLLLGSVAERILHRAPCPVLTVRRPPEAQPVQLSA